MSDRAHQPAPDRAPALAPELAALLAPIAGDDPCGADLAFGAEVDEIARARLADDPSLEQGAWVTALKEADWKFVGRRCAQLIATRSKDLQLAVWLAEAQAKTAGLVGLRDGLLLAGALCERYWEGLHPRADEDGFERRIGNLAWLAARLGPLVREMPLVAGGGVTLQGWEAARARGPEALAELEAARARSDPAFARALLLDAGSCLDALAGLERVLDGRLGADGPGFGAGRAALRDVADLLAAGLPADPATAVAPAAPGAAAMAPAAHGGAVAAPGGQQVEHRQQALAQLRQVAEFFRRTEPHSPVAYLADKAARWGEQPLHAWLRGVIKDDAALARLDELLGIERPPEG